MLYLGIQILTTNLTAVFKYFSIFYYAVPIQMITTLLFIIVGLANYKKINEFKSLLLYGIISMMQCILGVYISVFTDHDLGKITFIRNSINIFMLFEYIIFYSFIINSIALNVIKNILMIFFIGYVVVVLYCWIFTSAFNKPPAYLTIIESYLMIIGCLFYYLEIFVCPPKVKLLDHPKFWFVTGMLILFAFLVPFYLQYDNILLQYLSLYNTVYIMNFIGYTILFIFFNIGLRCQIKKSV